MSNAPATDLIRRMIDAGCPADIIADVAVLAGEVTALDRRRQADRERQAARRHVMSRDTVDVTDSHDAAPSLDKETPQTPKKIIPSPTPTGRVIPARARERFLPPEGLSDDQWKAFLQLRTAKRQPMTDRGYSLLCTKLTGLAEHGFPPGEMIDLAIERGWTTVHEPHDSQGPKNGRSNTLRGARPSPALDMLKRAAAEEAAERGGQADHRGAWPPLPAIGAG